MHINAYITTNDENKDTQQIVDMNTVTTTENTTGSGESNGNVECGMVEGEVRGSHVNNVSKFGLGTVLRTGWDARVTKNVGITAGCGSLFGGVLAVVRDAPSVASYAVRTGLNWGVMSMPFFVLREIMSGAREGDLGGVKGGVTDDVKDSGAAGLLTGYFGALWVHGPKFGKLAQWAGLGMLGGVVGDLGVKLVGEGVKLVRRKVRNGGDSRWSIWDWPVWFPVLKDVDVEYQELLKRKAVVEAELQEERRRIRVLLEQLERKEQLAAERSKIPNSMPSSPVTDISNGDSEDD